MDKLTQVQKRLLRLFEEYTVITIDACEKNCFDLSEKNGKTLQRQVRRYTFQALKDAGLIIRSENYDGGYVIDQPVFDRYKIEHP